jgi:protein-S-isoprenylcysteine O-methyltransferase Ste14
MRIPLDYLLKNEPLPNYVDKLYNFHYIILMQIFRGGHAYKKVARKPKPSYNGYCMDSKLIARYAIRETMGVVVMGVALFWSAGRIDWWPGWAATIVMAAWVLATAYVILRFNPHLLAERLGPRKGAKAWDTAILSVVGILQLARYIVAGLDQRYGWTGDFPLALQIAALLLCIPGYALVVWATASNAFFSQIVRIQSERGHHVASGGPYRYIRHPAYLGAILYELTVPILLASWWALLLSSLSAALLILRTHLEDRTLQVELPGYAEYVHQVPYRLIPGVW